MPRRGTAEENDDKARARSQKGEPLPVLSSPSAYTISFKLLTVVARQANLTKAGIYLHAILFAVLCMGLVEGEMTQPDLDEVK